MPPVRDHSDIEQNAEADKPRFYASSLPCMLSHRENWPNVRARAEELTNNPDANMKWAPVHYARGVVYRGRYRLVGWPKEEGVPFGNLSSIPGGQPVMDRLLSLWLDGTMHFEPVDDEYRDLAKRNPKAVLPANPPPRKAPKCWGPYGRDDIGKARARPVTNPEGKPLRRRKDGPRTPKLVLDSDIEDSDEVDSDEEA